MPKNKKLALNSGIQTYKILTNDDEVYIPSLYSILLAKQKPRSYVTFCVCNENSNNWVAENCRKLIKLNYLPINSILSKIFVSKTLRRN